MFEFMSNSPWLTFFLALIISETIVGIVRAITHHHEKDDDEEG